MSCVTSKDYFYQCKFYFNGLLVEPPPCHLRYYRKWLSDTLSCLGYDCYFARNSYVSLNNIGYGHLIGFKFLKCKDDVDFVKLSKDFKDAYKG